MASKTSYLEIKAFDKVLQIKYEISETYIKGKQIKFNTVPWVYEKLNSKSVESSMLH